VTATVRGSADALDGIDATVLKCDVTDEASLAEAAASVDSIDLLIVNAGINRGRGGIDAGDLGADAWSDVLMTNVAGPFFAVRAFLPTIKAPGGAKGRFEVAEITSLERGQMHGMLPMCPCLFGR